MLRRTFLTGAAATLTTRCHPPRKRRRVFMIGDSFTMDPASINAHRFLFRLAGWDYTPMGFGGASIVADTDPFPGWLTDALSYRPHAVILQQGYCTFGYPGVEDEPAMYELWAERTGRFVDTAVKAGVRPYLVEMPYGHREPWITRIEKTREITLAVANMLDVPVISWRTATDRDGYQPALRAEDAIHYTTGGYLVAATETVKVVDQ